MGATQRTSRVHVNGRVSDPGSVADRGRVSDRAGRAAVERRGEASPRLQVAEMQRTRLLAAAVGAVDEFGYADATVGQITARGRISRRTFYELFDNREDCLAAVLEDALKRIRHEIEASELKGQPWRERIRAGLWAILSFFDREPALARLCLLQSARGGESLLARRAEVFAQLACVIEEDRNESSRAEDAPQLTAEGLVGAAHAIVYERVLKRSPEPLTDLLPALMGMIVLPYLGPAAARRELSRSTPPPVVPRGQDWQEAYSQAEYESLLDIPMRLTYRTVRVLQAIAEVPGISNRAVGEQAGVLDQGQISKLLARLERLGLIVNTGVGHAKGEPNAWQITGTGTGILQSVCVYSGERKRARR